MHLWRACAGVASAREIAWGNDIPSRSVAGRLVDVPVLRKRSFIAELHGCSLSSHMGDLSSVPCHRMPPDAASERASEAASGREEAARRSPEGRPARRS